MKKKLIIGIIFGILLVIIAILILMLKITYIKHPTEEVKETCNVETMKYQDKDVYVVTPKDSEIKGKTVLYFHGGAYMADMSVSHWNFIKNFVNDAKVRVVLPEYPLAPKYGYEDVFNMVEPLYKEMVQQIGAENIVLMGDSAGGGLSLALLEKLEDDVSAPSKTITISPWLDVSMSNEQEKEVQKNDKELNIEQLKIAGIAYAGEKNLKNYLASPIYGDVSKLKNVTILTGTYDILNPDVYQLQKKANDAGIDIEVKTYNKAPHIWIITKNADNELVEQGYNDLISLMN